MTTSSLRILNEISSLPELINEEIDCFEDLIKQGISAKLINSFQRIYIIGSGDSYMAGVASEYAFESISGIPTEPFVSLQASRYAAPFTPPRTLAIGISASGNAARTCEALENFKKFGATTLAVTANLQSPVAKAANFVLNSSIGGASFPGEVLTGIRSYRASLIMMYLLAIRFGEVRGTISRDEVARLEEELRSIRYDIEETIELNISKARKLAQTFGKRLNYICIGHGPNYATAQYIASELVEEIGAHAIAQDTEEWVHLLYLSVAERDMPTFLVSPGFRGHSRAVEVVEPMKRVGRTVIAIVNKNEEKIANKADFVLPVASHCCEEFTPLIFPIPGELFACQMVDTTGNQPYRYPREGINAAYSADSTTRTSKIETEYSD